jgi:3-phenylpropionate/cinnamic acid dioxygenase small subunit
MAQAGSALAPQDAQELLFREAWCLDGQRWDEWLALYEPQARFWVPTWRSEHEPVQDPRTESSLIYAGTRQRLEERVRRVRLGKTPTAQPLPRTLHMVSNVLVQGGNDAEGHQVSAGWMVRRYDAVTQRDDVFYGRYEYLLRRHEGALRIASKVVYLLNDRVTTYIDFFCV